MVNPVAHKRMKDEAADGGASSFVKMGRSRELFMMFVNRRRSLDEDSGLPRSRPWQDAALTVLLSFVAFMVVALILTYALAHR